jgi:hypothetical protein
MSDDNTTNLPILDDIITPGDADKAVVRPSRKQQSSLWDDESTDPAAADNNREALLSEIDSQDHIIPSLAEDQLSVEANDSAETPGSTETDDTPALEQNVISDTPAGVVATSAAADHIQDIESLTDEIMAAVTPEIERIVRDKIQQALAKRLPAKPDSSQD